ncbi:MAG: radical SAM protein, partial [Alistipes sp.]|nr:radical SAM protein [Alistipes sp.]
MIDGIGRNIDYLRISVTDKCNLRCKYCMPEEGVKRLPHDMLLSLEEIYRVVLVMADLGVRKIRFTGGEPLVRKNLVKLISDVRRIPGIEEIALTTNGILLGKMAEELKAAGVDRVNVSLDTCDAKTFAAITGYDGYQ